MTPDAPHAPCAAAWSTTLQSGSPVGPAVCLAWSDEGQVLVANADTLHILTPGIGYTDPPLGAGAHWTSVLSAAKELERFPLPDALDEECATLTPPVQRTDTWIAAAWSPPGLGPHASCVLACLLSRGPIGLYVAHDDALRGPWTRSVDLDAPHAQGRSPAAARLATMYTTLAWMTATHDTLLVAGTRGGDVVVWRAPRDARDAWAYAASYRCDAAVARVACEARHVAVHTTRALVILTWDDGALHLERQVAWPRAVSCLVWDDAGLHVASPGVLATWAPGAAAPHMVRVPCAYVAGTLSHAVVLDTGRVVTWDGATADAPPPWSTDAQPVWGAAAHDGLVATLASADENASWRYRVARRTAYTLWTPFAAGWGIDDADTRARLAACLPRGDGVPIPAWRAALLAAQQCAQPARAVAHVAACVRTQRWAPLVATCATLVAKDEAHFAAWDAPLRSVQSVRWCAAWLARTQPDDDIRALADETAHVGDVVAALAAAVAASEAQQGGAYAARLAARLVLLSRTPPAALHGVEQVLQRRARALHAGSSAWEGERCTLGEKCVACGAPVAFTLAPYAQCDAGHVFERCVATFALLDTPATQTCVGCDSQASVATLNEVRGAFPSAAACSRCGNRWRSG
ncbi:hypothetical protein MBRA1_001320 [Malassezia brasiliensis]|uniref:Transcription factor IIIC 90kDa subunit N-terminal domain-containing protein n=1 Tax=Malassezia brasiliensis TaxID=1821822 RepID=A0AAF0DS53_9BASI|nr:hypothetical protein MBRA1_001320 [Malassezia brasiliensis]